MSKKIDIIRLYLQDYGSSMPGREIARKARINHQTALIYLNGLVKDNILKYNIRGRNKEYYLDLSSLRSRMMVEIAEIYNALLLLENQEISIIIPEVLAHCKSLIVFGSFASGMQHASSDMDLLAIGADRNGIDKIRKRYTREINVHYASLKEFRGSIMGKKPLAMEILKNHVLFGNTSKTVDMFWRWYSK